MDGVVGVIALGCTNDRAFRCEHATGGAGGRGRGTVPQ
jgi:hypothetical protein